MNGIGATARFSKNLTDDELVRTAEDVSFFDDDAGVRHNPKTVLKLRRVAEEAGKEAIYALEMPSEEWFYQFDVHPSGVPPSAYARHFIAKYLDDLKAGKI